MVLKFKNQTPQGGFAFYYQHPKTGEEIRVPEGNKSANGLQQLVGIVTSAFVNNGIQVPSDLLAIVEHQICLRQPDPLSVCYSGGLGDSLHHKVMKPMLRTMERAAAAVGAKRTAKAAKSAGRCSSCGGSTTYRQGINNLGRAGVLNKLNSGKFASNADHKR